MTESFGVAHHTLNDCIAGVSNFKIRENECQCYDLANDKSFRY